MFYWSHILPLLLINSDCDPDSIILDHVAIASITVLQLIILLIYVVFLYMTIIICFWACKFDLREYSFYNIWIYFIFKLFTRVLGLLALFTILIWITHLTSGIYLIYVELIAFWKYSIIALIFAYRNRRFIFKNLKPRELESRPTTNLETIQ